MRGTLDASMRYMRHVLGFILLTGCVHSSSASLDLQSMLSLRVVEAPQTVVAGGTIEVTFAVRNESQRQLSLCSPSGVTMQLRSTSPDYVWPIIIHGMTTDTDCSGPFTLTPGEEKIFIERGVVRRDLPTNVAQLIGEISLSCRDTAAQRNCQDASLHAEQTVRVSHGGV